MKKIVLATVPAVVFVASSLPVVGQTPPPQKGDLHSKRSHRGGTAAAVHGRPHANRPRQDGTTSQQQPSPFACSEPRFPLTVTIKPSARRRGQRQLSFSPPPTQPRSESQCLKCSYQEPLEWGVLVGARCERATSAKVKATRTIIFVMVPSTKTLR
jgi:hypothetical protein